MKILYICTHNRCRSILSEAITNAVLPEGSQAFSAGSAPADEVHSLTIQYLTKCGYSIDNLRSKSWNDFEAQQPDIVITVCDNAANEECPLWFGNTIKVHWGLQDPSKVNGDEAELDEAFMRVINIIERRAKAIVGLLESDLQEG